MSPPSKEQAQLQREIAALADEIAGRTPPLKAALAEVARLNKDMDTEVEIKERLMTQIGLLKKERDAALKALEWERIDHCHITKETLSAARNFGFDRTLELTAQLEKWIAEAERATRREAEICDKLAKEQMEVLRLKEQLVLKDGALALFDGIGAKLLSESAEVASLRKQLAEQKDLTDHNFYVGIAAEKNLEGIKDQLAMARGWARGRKLALAVRIANIKEVAAAFSHYVAILAEISPTTPPDKLVYTHNVPVGTKCRKRWGTDCIVWGNSAHHCWEGKGHSGDCRCLCTAMQSAQPGGGSSGPTPIHPTGGPFYSKCPKCGGFGFPGLVCSTCAAAQS